MADAQPCEEAFSGKKPSDLYEEQYVDKNGGVLILKEAEVSLHIPEGALEEPTLISIEIVMEKEEQNNGISPPRSFTPTVACKPNGKKFKKPVELILPHCAVFDDFSFHKASVQCHSGEINIGCGKEVSQDAHHQLKERVCHIFITHFSNFSVSIGDTMKKRIGVVPLTGTNTEDTLNCEVWFVNDLPSEYIILRYREKEKDLVPFSINGKFILHNAQYLLQAKATVYGDNENPLLKEKKLDNNMLLCNSRLCDTFQATFSNRSAIAKNYNISVLRETRQKPASILRKNDQRSINQASIVEELTQCCDQISRCLLEWELEDVPNSPLFDDDTIQSLKEIVEELERNMSTGNIATIGASTSNFLRVGMPIVAILLPVLFSLLGVILVVSAIVLSYASGYWFCFSTEKTVRDRLRKGKTKARLNDFANVHKDLLYSSANLFEARSALTKLNDIHPEKFINVRKDGLEKLKQMIIEHEAGLNVDFINLPEILQQVKIQSTELVEYLKHIEEITGNKLLELEENSLKTVANRHKMDLQSYEAQEKDVVTFVDFTRDYLKLDNIDLQETVAMTSRSPADTTNDIAYLGGNALKIANGFTSAGIALGAVGTTMDADFSSPAAYNRVKEDEEKFSQGLLEVVDLMEQMNRIKFRSRNISQEYPVKLRN